MQQLREGDETVPQGRLQIKSFHELRLIKRISDFEHSHGGRMATIDFKVLKSNEAWDIEPGTKPEAVRSSATKAIAATPREDAGAASNMVPEAAFGGEDLESKSYPSK